MSRFLGLALAAVLLTAIAGAAGGWIGVQYGLREASADASLDQMLHHRLKLTADQDRRIEVMEKDFASHRQVLEQRMQAANGELAGALQREHDYGPSAEQAIGHFHAAMGELQEATVQHILAMRAVLTPEQAARFDKTVSDALAPSR